MSKKQDVASFFKKYCGAIEHARRLKQQHPIIEQLKYDPQAPNEGDTNVISMKRKVDQSTESCLAFFTQAKLFNEEESQKMMSWVWLKLD